MSLSIDLDARTLTAAIRDLAEAVHATPRGLGLLARARAALGQEVHARYREARARDVPGFRAEVPLRLDLVVDGVRAVLSGRVDGQIETADRVILEEVKSVAISGGELAHADAELFPDFAWQLKLYGLALTTTAPPAAPVLGRLILVSLLDGTQHEVVVDLDPEATRQALVAQLRELLAEAEWRRTRARRLAALAEELRFPYPEPRPHQDTLLAELDEALTAERPVLAMAPTGIGKTAAALFAGLRHALRTDAHLFFLTAKTTQQALVVETFRALCAATGAAADELRCLTLRAKERMCATGTLLCHPELCPYLKDSASRLERSSAVDQALAGGPAITPEIVRMVGEAHRLCPFGLSLALAPQVHVIVGDYNYVYDPGIALGAFFGAEARHRAVVVVDEAHNLFDRARGYYSPRITRRELTELRQRFAKGEFLAAADATPQERLPGALFGVDGPQLFTRLATLCGSLDRALAQTLRRAEEETAARHEDCRACDLDLDEWSRLAEQATELAVLYAVYNRAHQLVRPRDPVLDLLTQITRIRDVLALEEREFVPYVAGPRAPDGPAMGILCVNPAGQLAQRHGRTAGTVAMSATLVPLAYYSDVLGFAPLDPLTLSLPSPFPPENLGAWIAPGVSTTYRERGRHRKAIARIIRDTCAARPGRYAAYFPSYAFLEQVRPHLGLDPAQVLVQRASLSAAEREALLARFGDAPPPRLLLAVMGGVFAEGVDLPGEALVGAVVVSPGLPQIGFERTQMQLYFEAQDEGRGFAYAMLYPGLQRVVQAAGRVIRTDDDQGVIVLVGRRFAREEVTRCLPEHWYRYDPRELLAEDLPAQLRAFWQGRGAPAGR